MTKIPPPHNASVLRLLVRAVLVAACVAGIAVSVIVYRSEGRTADSLKTLLAGGGDEATLRQLRDAETPFNPESLRDTSEATVLTLLGRADEGERLLQDTVRREPENQLVWVTLSRIQVTAGRTAAARRSYRRALALNSQTPRSIDMPPPLRLGGP
jgi:cytochrome c-type biogenesis protein CcmH/NrfG